MPDVLVSFPVATKQDYYQINKGNYLRDSSEP
jgi:hypothetical protein